MCYSASFGARSGRSKGKQSKSKTKGKKCGLCNKKGHGEDECPDKVAEGRVQNKNSGGAGGGISHKGSRKATVKKLEEPAEETPLELPEGFVTSSGVTATNAENPFLFFDTGCDIGATLDALSSMKKTKGSGGAPSGTYREGLASSASNYGGCLCRQLLKPGRPWKADAPRNLLMKEADSRAFFVLGLGPRFSIREDDDSKDDESDDDDSDDSEAMEALTDAIEDDHLVVGVFAKLDYTPSVLELPGYDKETQLRRFRATCKAALETDVPVQCRIAPAPGTATGKEETGEKESEDDPYATVVRDLAKVLHQMSPGGSDASSPQLRIHLSSWNGTSEHMSTLLQAFPETLYVGLNASVGFTKAATAHECAFDIALDRLLLETDAPFAIPTPVAVAMGRTAFCHSGLLPFCAAAVADQKKNLFHRGNPIDAVYVARIAAENTVRLYGRGVAVRAEEAASRAAAMLLEADKKRQEEEEEEEEESAGLLLEEGEGKSPQLEGEEVIAGPVAAVETKKDKKKKKKKRGQAANAGQQQHHHADGASQNAEANFDDDCLANLIDDRL